MDALKAQMKALSNQSAVNPAVPSPGISAATKQAIADMVAMAMVPTETNRMDMSDLTKAQEHAIDAYLRSRGIGPLTNPGEPAGQGDRLIDGVRTEYKTISGVQSPDEATISAAISLSLIHISEP